MVNHAELLLGNGVRLVDNQMEIIPIISPEEYHTAIWLRIILFLLLLTMLGIRFRL